VPSPHESGMMQSSSEGRLLACVVDTWIQDAVVSAGCIRAPAASPATPHAWQLRRQRRRAQQQRVEQGKGG